MISEFYNKLFLIFFLVSGLYQISRAQNRIDFGVEVQSNTNKVKKWESTSFYDPSNISLSVEDVSGDTLDIYFNEFSWENNFEIPLYFRLNRKRHFVDVKLSSSFNTLKMEGIANYNQGFYTTHYGTYQDFEAQAISDGFTNVDTSDYRNYIAAAREDYESGITYTEQFQLLSLSMNYGYRFLPHKSVKPFISTGFTVKGKFRKMNYEYLDFSNEYIQDLSSVNGAVNKFAETSLYFNFIGGIEMYRFRLSAYFQTGLAFTFPGYQYAPNIVYRTSYTPFDELYSYGFNLGVDLFSFDFGRKIKKDNVSKDDLEISNIKRQTNKWDIGFRFSRRGFNELSTFYADSSARLSVLKTDSVLISENGTIKQAINIELATFGDIKRIGWSPQFEVFGSYNFRKRWTTEMALGFSTLNFDVHTTELRATVAEDSSGESYYVNTASSPKLRSGVYRKAFNLFHLKPSISFKPIVRDIFDLRLTFGLGITVMSHKFIGGNGFPPGVNELDVYADVEESYYFPIDQDIAVYRGEMAVDLNESPDEVTAKFDAETDFSNWESPYPFRLAYPILKLGIEANIDRFSLGLFIEGNTHYMDGFMLRKYSTIFFSIGYKVFRR